MDNVVNAQRLSDSNVDASEKLRTSVYLKKDTYLKIDSLIKLSGTNPSRNDVIEQAVDFLFAYNTLQISQDYLCGVFGAKMEGLINNLGSRISRGNFRTAVEMDMHTRMLASVVRLSGNDYEKLRKKSVQDVKQTNGSIDIMEAVNESEDEM